MGEFGKNLSEIIIGQWAIKELIAFSVMPFVAHSLANCFVECTTRALLGLQEVSVANVITEATEATRSYITCLKGMSLP